jgi:hypothetical protein
MGDTATQTVILNSRDRYEPDTNTVGDFYVDLLPKDGRVLSLSLKYASFPFGFKNVTLTYGNSIRLLVYPDKNLLPHYTFNIVLDPNYYSIASLLVAMNTQIADLLSIHGATFQMEFVFSQHNGKVALQTTNPLLQVVFDTSIFPYNLRYVYSMLGVSNRQNTTITNYDTLGVSTQDLPFFATQELPFQAILVSMDQYPDDVFSTSRVSGLFVIPVHGYNALETLLAGQSHSTTHGIQWNSNMKFDQIVQVERSLSNIQTVHVRLYDDAGNALTEHFQENDFILIFEVEKIKTWF